ATFSAPRSLAQNTPPTFRQCSGLNVNYVSGECGSLLQIKEEIPIDTSLFTVEATDAEGDDVEFTLVGDATLLYFFKLRTNKVARSALVMVNSRIDSESLSSPVGNLILRMNDFKGNVIDKSIMIYIVDQNDNLPEFQNLPYRWEVPENTLWTAETSFNVTVLDRDKTSSSYRFTYVLTSTTANLFNESYRTSRLLSAPQTGSIYLSTVSLMQPLDYEANRFYQVSVYVTERVTGGRNTSTDIVVSVLDRQDTPPVFEGTPYLVSVTENSPIGSLLMTVLARDGDRGVPNPVQYLLDNSSALASLFSLNRTTGRLEVASSIDRESAQIAAVYASFSLNVIAEEVSTGSPQPANLSRTTTSVRITVQDVNDVTPTFSRSAYNATVLENTVAGTPVSLLAACTVTDHDDGDNSAFDLTIVLSNGSAFDVFDVLPSSAVGTAALTVRVKDSTVLDYEATKSIEFQIVARESKTTARLSSTATFTVFLLDANDNAPRFNQSKYEFSVPENSPNGTIVGKVDAFDIDSGDFAKISYSLGGTDANKFIVNGTTGQIQVGVRADEDLSLLDREKFPILYLTLQATDGGGLTGSSQLEIHLLDKNDQRPAFQRTFYEGAVKENSLSMESVVQLVAVDSDLFPNNVITYSLLPSNSSASFAIDNATGVLSVQRPLDYEALANKTLVLKAEAADGGSPSLSSTVEIRIAVVDQNDLAPECSQRVYSGSVPETAGYGTRVAELAGSDGDSPGSPNSQVFFRILAGAGDRFTLDAGGSGVIVERGADLDVNKLGVFHNLTIGIFDRGTPQLTGAPCFVHINVSDVNNKAPYFEPVTTRVTVSEGSATFAPLFQPSKTAIDPDSSANLTYSLLTNITTGRSAGGGAVASTPAYNFSTLFSIDPLNATLYAMTALDRETAQELTVQVLARDLNAATPTPVQTATGTIVLTLTDINNKPPRFLSTGSANNYTVQVSESLAPPIPINLKLQADDPDVSTVSLAYAIAPPGISQFAVDSASGQVSLVQRLDYEKISRHEFIVTVSDGLHVTSASVTIEVINANTYDPVFDQFPTPLSYPESTPVGTVVATVHAYDNDSGVFGQVVYSLLAGDAFFNVASDSGRVTLVRQLDRDVSGGDQQLLVIEGVDNPSGIDRRRVSRQMVINVKDVNDCSPTFPSGLFTFRNLKENYQAGFEIDSVRATDKDVGRNSELRYELIAAPGQSADALQLFRVSTTNATDGYYAQLRVNQSLTGRRGWYNLTLVAKDSGSPQLTGSTVLSFFVAKADDFTLVDDEALARFRSALIGTNVILIAGCGIALTCLILMYCKYRRLSRQAEITIAAGESGVQQLHLMKRLEQQKQAGEAETADSAADNGKPSKHNAESRSSNIDAASAPPDDMSRQSLATRAPLVPPSRQEPLHHSKLKADDNLKSSESSDKKRKKKGRRSHKVDPGLDDSRSEPLNNPKSDWQLPPLSRHHRQLGRLPELLEPDADHQGDIRS
uniref:Cadherin domain-containing protein n=1 Tax=Macrostomum lignano TaxID=282301 RepID=A0A1I8HT64_9PLAT